MKTHRLYATSAFLFFAGTGCGDDGSASGTSVETTSDTGTDNTTSGGETTTDTGDDTTTTTTGSDETTDGGAETTTGGAVEPEDIFMSIQYGDFEALPGVKVDGVIGHALMIRTLPGQADYATRIEVYVEGLSANTAYNVHVHTLPCGVDDGGGHYKIDPTTEGTEEDNELWPAFTTNDLGIGISSIDTPHLARGGAQSIVVHDPANGDSKMVCANLLFGDPGGPIDYEGMIASFAAAAAGDETISGTASMRLNSAGTSVSLTVSGLNPAEQYVAHVHALPCDVADAGGHYKLDPTVEATVEENEIWPEVTPDEKGDSSSMLELDEHWARGDAQSVVIHRRIDPDNAPKVACAPLLRTQYPSDVTTEGEAIVLAAGDENYSGDIDATATMWRTLSGLTRVELTASGLTTGEFYPTHVHAYSCALMDGGGHYEIEAADEVDESNEIWLNFEGGAEIEVVSEVLHTARPDAQSVVVHDHVKGTPRLMCIDLALPQPPV